LFEIQNTAHNQLDLLIRVEAMWVNRWTTKLAQPPTCLKFVQQFLSNSCLYTAY
jgi:hypothetical protein